MVANRLWRVMLMVGSFFLQFLIQRADPCILIMWVGIALMIPSLLFSLSMNVIALFENPFLGTALKALSDIGVKTSFSTFNIVAPTIVVAIGAGLVTEWALVRRVCK